MLRREYPPLLDPSFNGGSAPSSSFTSQSPSPPTKPPPKNSEDVANEGKQLGMIKFLFVPSQGFFVQRRTMKNETELFPFHDFMAKFGHLEEFQKYLLVFVENLPPSFLSRVISAHGKTSSPPDLPPPNLPPSSSPTTDPEHTKVLPSPPISSPTTTQNDPHPATDPSPPKPSTTSTPTAASDPPQPRALLSEIAGCFKPSVLDVDEDRGQLQPPSSPKPIGGSKHWILPEIDQALNYYERGRISQLGLSGHITLACSGSNKKMQVLF